ncbi:MAG: HPF/RaiA family ribosome-associated protein [Cyclonatronaceae bacterium]
MKIQVNTDKNIPGGERLTTFLSTLISDDLSRFSDRITRVEVHLSDVNGRKEGDDDKRCLMEARLEGLQPIVVTSHANKHEVAVSTALDKLVAKIDSKLGRLGKR